MRDSHSLEPAGMDKPSLLGLVAAGIILFSLCAAWPYLVRTLYGDYCFGVAVEAQNRINESRSNLSLSDASRLRRVALGYLQQATIMNPLSGNALANLASEKAGDRDYVAAKDAALQANKTISSVDTQNQLGLIFYRLKDNENAEWFFRSALGISPSNRTALEYLTLVCKANCDKSRSVDERQRNLEKMMISLRDLEYYHYPDPNRTYLWSQAWHVFARSSKSPLHFFAGYRAAALTLNAGALPEYRPLYDEKALFMAMNYFMMGARGLPVQEGKPFSTKPLLDLDLVQLHD